MKYELRNIEFIGTTENKDKDQKVVSMKQQAIITVGIVGDVYDFVKRENFSCDFSLDLKINEAKDFVNQKAIEYVSEKYPNI